MVEKEYNLNVFFDEFEFLDFVCSSIELKKNGILNFKVIYEEFLKYLGFNYLIKK